jgi:hypothetical protein
LFQANISIPIDQIGKQERASLAILFRKKTIYNASYLKVRKGKSFLQNIQVNKIGFGKLNRKFQKTIFQLNGHWHTIELLRIYAMKLPCLAQLTMFGYFFNFVIAVTIFGSAITQLHIAI